VATLADWGAEHRPRQPCTECGCTLWWTAAGADMCAICLPMPRLTDESRERIDNVFPRKGDMRRRPTHGAHLRQGMASGKAVRVEPFETPTRPAHPKARHVRLRGQPGVQRFLCRTLYTVLSCSSTRLWLLSRLLIELREERTTSDRLFRRVAEISQDCSSIRITMDPDALPSTINWKTFIALPPSTSWYQHRTQQLAERICAHFGCSYEPPL
jgi:hypothetical protein